MSGIIMLEFMVLPVMLACGVAAIHLLCAHILKNKHWHIIVAAFIVMGCLFLVASFHLLKRQIGVDGICYFLISSLIFSGLSYGYFTLVNLNITSVRIRLLKLLFSHPMGFVTEAELLKDYHPEVMVDMRLKRLISIYQVKEESGKYQLIRQDLVRLSALIQWFRKLLNITFSYQK